MLSSPHKHKLTESGPYNLNVRAKVIKGLEENMGVNLGDLGLNNAFLDIRIKKAQVTKEKWIN